MRLTTDVDRRTLQRQLAARLFSFDAHRARITGSMERLAKAAHEGICDRGPLIALAGQPEPSRPGDAVSLYRRVVPTIVEQTNNAACDEADGMARPAAATK